MALLKKRFYLRITSRVKLFTVVFCEYAAKEMTGSPEVCSRQSS
jgi:hypothetical protein